MGVASGWFSDGFNFLKLIFSTVPMNHRFFLRRDEHFFYVFKWSFKKLFIFERESTKMCCLIFLSSWLIQTQWTIFKTMREAFLSIKWHSGAPCPWFNRLVGKKKNKDINIVKYIKSEFELKERTFFEIRQFASRF